MSINENPHIINRKVMLVQKGYSNARLAREIGVTPQALSQAIRGITHSLRIHRAVVTKLGVSLIEFWPELYGDVVSHDSIISEEASAVN